jgi:Uma2 family endonuclease
MFAVAPPLKLTPSEYFDWEDQQELRHEYFDGQVFAMAGGSLIHADVALNIAVILQQQLAGRCKVRNSDAKVGISDQGPFVYPDVSVSCDPRDRTAQKFSRYPCLIVEVLSPGTEAYDRGGKFSLYRRLPSLQEYVLVGSVTKTVEIFRRGEGEQWLFTAYGENDQLDFLSLDFVTSMNAIYDGVELDR